MNYEIKAITQQLVEINKNFSSGEILNRSSLEFAIGAAYKSKDWQVQLAFVVRALLCDHIFMDGNKRTAATYIMAVMEDMKHKYDPFEIDRLVLKIAKRTITKTVTIRRMIDNATAKNF